MAEDQATAVVIEDDPPVQDLLVAVLESAGFRVIAVDNGRDGIQAAFDNDARLITVDVNLPGIDGFETVRRLRAKSTAGILLVTALSGEAEAVLGLSAGADDYVVKPFRLREFQARVEALMRRASTGARPIAATHVPASQRLSHLDLRLDAGARTALVGEEEVQLTRTEFELLRALLESGRVVRDKGDLALIVRGESTSSSRLATAADRRAIEAHVTNLRRKLRDDADNPRYIETVRGLGYRLTTDGPTQ